jgi:hypothetical protein
MPRAGAFCASDLTKMVQRILPARKVNETKETIDKNKETTVSL